MATIQQVLPKTVECPQCGSVMTLDDQERIERKYACPECGKLVDQSSPQIDELDPNALSEFKRQILEMTDEELLRIMSQIDDYTPSFLQLVIKEIESRNINPEERNQLEENTRESTAKIASVAAQSLSFPMSVLMFLLSFGIPQAIMAEYYRNRGFKKRHDDCWRMMFYGLGFYAILFFIDRQVFGTVIMFALALGVVFVIVGVISFAARRITKKAEW